MRRRTVLDRLLRITGACTMTLLSCFSPVNASGATDADACLTPAELESLRQKNTETLRVLQFDEVKLRSGEYTDAMREVFAARNEVDDCMRASERGLSGALGISPCNAEIRRHNQLLQKANGIASYVKTRMEIINKALELNRMTFRRCD